MTTLNFLSRQAPRTTYTCMVGDVGGTHLRLGLGDGAGRVHRVFKKRVRCFRDGYCPEEVADLLADDVAVYNRQTATLLAAAAPLILAFPGPVTDCRRARAAPTLLGPAVRVPDFHARLVAALGRPVYLVNDVTAAAWYQSTILGVDCFMTVTVSSGIGAKIFVRRHPRGVLDALPYAGELGHQVVDTDVNALPCDCGGRGHLGSVASGRGYELAARHEALADPENFAASASVRLFRATAQTLNNEEHLVPAVLCGDPWASEVLRRSVRFLARPLLTAALAVGAERVVLIGGFALALGGIYLEILREELRRLNGREPFAPDPAGLLMLGEPCEEACLRGAAVYAARQAGVELACA